MGTLFLQGITMDNINEANKWMGQLDNDVINEDVLSTLKGIVKDHSHAKVSGQEIDVQTANAILTVYDALKPETRKKFIKMPIKKMADFSWSVVRA